MKILDATFSTAELLKPGESLAPGQSGRVGASVLPGSHAVYWTGQFRQPYDANAIREWRKLCGPDRLGIIDFELVQHTIGLAQAKVILRACSAPFPGRTARHPVSTYGLYLGHRNLRKRDGTPYNPDDAAIASKAVLVDDAVIRRLEEQASLVPLMAYVQVEMMCSQPQHIGKYLAGHDRTCEILRVVFPGKPILSWVAGYWDHAGTATPMTAAEAERYLACAARWGDLCVWGQYVLNRPFYERSLEFLRAA